MLRPRKKITKKEIKEDGLVKTYVAVQKFIRNYSKQVNIAATIIIVIGMVAIFMARSKRKAEFSAAGQLGIAEQFYHAGDYPRAIQEFLPIIETYPGTRSAGDAAFLLANAYFKTGDTENAENYYRLVRAEYRKNPLFYASSIAGLASCLETKNEFEEAAQMYREAGESYPDHFSAPFYLKQAGRCFIHAGQREEGKEMYRRIIDDYPESSVREEVQFIVAKL